MTTEIVKNMSPRLPPLHRYARYLEDILEPKLNPVNTQELDVALVALFFLFLLCFGLSLP